MSHNTTTNLLVSHVVGGVGGGGGGGRGAVWGVNPAAEFVQLLVQLYHLTSVHLVLYFSPVVLLTLVLRQQSTIRRRRRECIF